MQTNIESLKQRINELHLEHRDLDDVIARLAEKPGQDQLQLQRLKKKKLLIKDQISHLERQLTPDISGPKAAASGFLLPRPSPYGLRAVSAI